MATLRDDGAPISKQNFCGSDFSHADLSEREFDHCDFSGCSFRGADLQRSTFRHCQFNDSSSQTPADFSQAQLREAGFFNCNLTVVEFCKCTGYDLVFEHCQMQGADLSKSDFRLPIGATELASLNMRHCNFSFGTLANNYLVECTLSDSRLLEACFDYCDLSNANLTGSELHNIHGDQLVLAGADLRGATFNNIDPRRIDLTGVHLEPEQLPALLEPLGVVLHLDQT